jgi:hypothetical protein
MRQFVFRSKSYFLFRFGLLDDGFQQIDVRSEGLLAGGRQ